MKKGDILLLPFPFTNLSGSKLRPVVVLFCNELDVTVSFITSNLKSKEKFRYLIKANLQNGLKTDSLLKVSKICTVEISLIKGLLGEISTLQIKALDRIFTQLLKLDE